MDSAFTQPLSLGAYESASFPLQQPPIMSHIPSISAMPQQTQFIAAPTGPFAHTTGGYPVIQYLPCIVPDPLNFDHQLEGGVIPKARPVRNRRNADAQRQYRERKKRMEQERDAEVAALKSKVAYLVDLLKSRYSHDPSLELQLVSRRTPDDIPPSLLEGSTVATSDQASASYAGRPTIPLDTTTRRSENLGINPQTCLPTPLETVNSSTRGLVNNATTTHRSNYDGGIPTNYTSQSQLSNGSLDIDDLATFLASHC